MAKISTTRSSGCSSAVAIVFDSGAEVFKGSLTTLEQQRRSIVLSMALLSVMAMLLAATTLTKTEKDKEEDEVKRVLFPFSKPKG